MSGKGDKRRPMQISQEELDKRWEAVFKNKPAEDMFDHLMIDKILTKEVEKLVPDDEVAVLLSGGVDSISVAFAAALDDVILGISCPFVKAVPPIVALS